MKVNKMKKHVISMIVEDQPGVLTRISGLFARRGYNIETISVGKTIKPGESKMVVTVLAENDKEVEQIEKQVNKLIDTIKVTSISKKDSVTRELALIKITTRNKQAKDEIFNYAKVYKTKFIDVTLNSVTLEMVGNADKIDSFIDLVKGYGIKDISRTGVTAMVRKSNGNGKN